MTTCAFPGGAAVFRVTAQKMIWPFMQEVELIIIVKPLQWSGPFQSRAMNGAGRGGQRDKTTSSG